MALIADYSEITLMNAALRRIQHDAITDFDDQLSTAARMCKAAYPRLRDALQRSFGWNFNKERVTLAADGTPPPFGYTARYALPSDMLKVRRIFGYENSEWEVEGQFVLINATGSINVEYTKKITDPDKFDALFTKLLEYELAAELAPVLARDEGLVDRIDRQVKKHRRTAQLIDASEARRDQPDDVPYLTGRV